MKNNIMLPCPFCGSKDIDIIKESDYWRNAIWCKDCPAGIEDCDKTLDELTTLWNTRTN